MSLNMLDKSQKLNYKYNKLHHHLYQSISLTKWALLSRIMTLTLFTIF